MYVIDIDRVIKFLKIYKEVLITQKKNILLHTNTHSHITTTHTHTYLHSPLHPHPQAPPTLPSCLVLGD